jgi:hypothetical protein
MLTARWIFVNRILVQLYGREGFPFSNVGEARN